MVLSAALPLTLNGRIGEYILPEKWIVVAAGNRPEDLGYLVARIFVNKDKYFISEGKRQADNVVSAFGKTKLGREELVRIVELAILYTLSFDLLIPPFDLIKIASVEQINDKIESAKHQTGKRMGYKYNSDDILE